VTRMYFYPDAAAAREYMCSAIDGWGVAQTYLKKRIRDLSRFFTTVAPELVSSFDHRVKESQAAVKIEGGWARRVDDEFPFLVDVIRSLFEEDRTRVAIVEDPLVRPTDASLRNGDCTVRYLDESVLYVIGATNNLETCVPRTQLNVGHSALFVTHVPDDEPLDRMLSHRQLENLVEQAEVVVTAVFQGEGFLIGMDDHVRAMGGELKGRVGITPRNSDEGHG
jgi:hypothetical protein